MNGRPGIFLDRDGVVNRPPPPHQRYVTRPEDFHLEPGIAAAVREFNRRGLPVAVVTNQKGIALGRYSEEDLGRIHDRMRELLAAEGARVDTVRHCPHTETDHCLCRKPLPGMLLDAAAELDLDPGRSWMIGDQPRDLEAGRAAGCRTLFVGTRDLPPGLADAQVPAPESLAAWISEIFPFQTKPELP